MKFTDLSTHKQELLKSYINGETIEYFSDVLQTWRLTTSTLETLEALDDKNLRVKPKEPVVKLECFAIYDCGYVSNIRYDSIQYSPDEVTNYHLVVSWLVKRYIDDVFIKAEIVQE